MTRGDELARRAAAPGEDKPYFDAPAQSNTSGAWTKTMPRHLGLFGVVVEDGRIASQNVSPLAFVF